MLQMGHREPWPETGVWKETPQARQRLRVEGDFALDRRRQGQDPDGSTVADVRADAASGAGVGIDAIGQGPCTAPCVPAHQPNGTGRTEAGTGVATRAGRRVYDRCEGNEMLGGCGREVPSGEKGLGVFPLRLGVRPTRHLVHRRTDRLAEEGPAVEGGPSAVGRRPPGRAARGRPRGPRPGTRRAPGSPASAGRSPGGCRCASPRPGDRHRNPHDSATRRVTPSARRASRARRPRAMDAGQDTAIPDLEDNLAGGIGHKSRRRPDDGPDRIGHGWPPGDRPGRRARSRRSARYRFRVARRRARRPPGDRHRRRPGTSPAPTGNARSVGL